MYALLRTYRSHAWLLACILIIVGMIIGNLPTDQYDGTLTALLFIGAAVVLAVLIIRSDPDNLQMR